ITDDELLENAGLDAIAFIRLLRLGTRVAVVGCLNAIYLIPVYKYQGSGPANEDELARKKVRERNKPVLMLEHEYNIWHHRGVRPQKRSSFFSKEKIDVIEVLEVQRTVLNDFIERDFSDAECFQEMVDEQSPRRKVLDISSGANMVPLVPLKKLVPSKSFRVLSDGFVTFKSLQFTAKALQMQLYDEPHALCIESAPLPDGVYWSNVGMPHFHQQLGIVMSLAATTALCIFWTIPVTFVVSISKVSFLKEELHFLQKRSRSLASSRNRTPTLIPHCPCAVERAPAVHIGGFLE
ncbi:hypothetical protein Pmar_PMAR024484, partial [Perkinsus marinus ATCC 50983]